MKVKIEVNNEDWKKLQEDLQEDSQAVMFDALNLLAWVVSEAKQGNHIVSVSNDFEVKQSMSFVSLAKLRERCESEKKKATTDQSQRPVG